VCVCVWPKVMYIVGDTISIPSLVRCVCVCTSVFYLWGAGVVERYIIFYGFIQIQSKKMGVLMLYCGVCISQSFWSFCFYF
jgi:hypothetical protein